MNIVMHMENTLHLSQPLGDKYFGGRQMKLDGGVGDIYQFNLTVNYYVSSQTHITAFSCLVVNIWFG